MLKRKRFSQTERDFINRRANGCCEYCQMLYNFSPDTFEIEHIISLFEGGTNELDNLAFSCGGCNSHKHYKIKAIDSFTNETTSLFNPRTDMWLDHFQWEENFSIIQGKTSKGRATVEVLKFNRTGLVNLRKALVNYGVFPPFL